MLGPFIPGKGRQTRRHGRLAGSGKASRASAAGKAKGLKPLVAHGAVMPQLLRASDCKQNSLARMAGIAKQVRDGRSTLSAWIADDDETWLKDSLYRRSGRHDSGRPRRLNPSGGSAAGDRRNHVEDGSGRHWSAQAVKRAAFVFADVDVDETSNGAGFVLDPTSDRRRLAAEDCEHVSQAARVIDVESEHPCTPGMLGQRLG